QLEDARVDDVRFSSPSAHSSSSDSVKTEARSTPQARDGERGGGLAAVLGRCPLDVVELHFKPVGLILEPARWASTSRTSFGDNPKPRSRWHAPHAGVT